MTLHKRLVQIAVEEESAEGTAEALVDADATMAVYPDASYTSDIQKFKRDPARASLAKLRSVIGKQLAQLSWRCEFKGSGSVGTEPAWNDAILGCGFQKKTVSSIDIGAVSSGPFYPGETVNGGTSSATGRVVCEVENGDSVVHMIDVTGTWQSGETITGGTSGASATTSSTETADQGFAYVPDSSSPPSMTVARYMNGVRHLIHGARGNLSIPLTGGEPGFLQFAYQGVYNDPTDLALLSPTYETTVPPAFLNVALRLHGVDYSTEADFGDLGLDLGNTLTPLGGSGRAKGVKSFFIGGRDVTADIDPEMELVADHDFYGRASAGSVGYLCAKWGSSAGNILVIAAPTVEYGNPGDSDDGGIARLGLPLDICSESLDDIDDDLIIAMI